MTARRVVWATMMVGMGLFSPAGYTMNLVEAVYSAQHHDAVYQAARAQYEADQHAVRMARAAFLPHLSALAGRQFQSIHVPSAGRRSDGSNSWSIALNQSVLDMPRTAAYHEAQQGQRASLYRWRAARHDLVARVVRHYFDVVDARMSLVALRALKRSVYQHYRLARRSFDVGRNSVVDVLEAQTSLRTVSAQEIEARNHCLMTYAALVSLVGQDASPVYPLRTRIQWPTLLPLPHFVEKARYTSPLITAAWFAHAASQERVAAARAGHFPQVALFLSRSYNGAAPMLSTIATYATTVGVQLSVPIFSGGATSAAVDQASAISQSTFEHYLAVRRQTVLETTAAFTTYHGGRHQVDALTVALLSAKTQLKAAQLGYEVGQSTTLDVLDAQQHLFHIRQQLASTRLNTLYAYVQLHIIAGIFDVHTLDFVSRQFFYPEATSHPLSGSQTVVSPPLLALVG